MELPRQALQNALLGLDGRDADSGGRRLLVWLGWAAPVPEVQRADRMALLRVALLCGSVFGLVLPRLPRLCAVGAQLDLAAATGEADLPVISASGVGLDPGAAFAACMGEAAERLAQVEMPEDRQGDEAVPLYSWPSGAARAWPRDLVFRRAADRRTTLPPFPLSIGCAAGPSPEAARLAALLEIVERDAVALWWRGGIAADRIPPEHPVARAAAATNLALGATPAARPDMLLDITSELGVPTVAAIAFDAQGHGFCCGTAARPVMADAARAAMMERAQNELAVALAEAKRAALGPQALTPRDHAHLHRHAAVTVAVLSILPASGNPRGLAMPGLGFAEIAARLLACGHEVLLHDHRRDWLGMHVSRVFVTGLACEPSSDTPPRLAAAIRGTGGGPGLRLPVSLFS